MAPSPRSRRPLAVFTGLVALTTGCAGGEHSAPLRQEQAPLSSARTPPATCADIRAAWPDATDGEYLLYVKGDITRAWAAWCQDMADAPTEYLTLAQTSHDLNFSEYAAGGPSPGTSVRTSYTRLRIDPRTFVVDTANQRFSRSTGELEHSPTTVTSMPYATAMSCTGDNRLGQAGIDLRGTPFALLGRPLRTAGSAPDGNTQYGDQDQRAWIRGGGFCGWTAPIGSFNPFNQNGASLPLQHLPDLPKPASCADVRDNIPGAQDGTYVLYVDRDASKPWLAYCHDLAGTPTEYLTLAQTGHDLNFSEYAAGGPSPGTPVRTSYTRLRIDPRTLTVDTADQRFTTSTGSLEHSPDRVTSMPYAVAMSCMSNVQAQASIDLRGTSFELFKGQFALGGSGPRGTTTIPNEHQVYSLTGGGYCGWNAPAGSFNPYNQRGASLRLLYRPATY